MEINSLLYFWYKFLWLITFSSSTNKKPYYSYFSRLFRQCHADIWLKKNWLERLKLHVKNLGLICVVLTAPRGLPGFWMVARDAQTNLLPNFESSIWLGRKKKEVEESMWVEINEQKHKLSKVVTSSLTWKFDISESFQLGNAGCYSVIVRVFRQFL